MDNIFLRSLNEKIKEVEAQIQKIKYIQEFDKAREFEQEFLQTMEKIRMLRQGESQTHIYYRDAMDCLDAIKFGIDDYMEKEGKIKEQELNRTIFLEKLKRFIDDTKGKSSQQLLTDLKEMVQEIRKLELAIDLFSELYSLTAKALLCTFMEQAKKRETIDFELVEEVTTPSAFAKEIQNQLTAMAEEQKEDKVAAYDILKISQEVTEENMGELKVWQTLTGKKEVEIKRREAQKELPAEESQETELVSLEVAQKTVFERLRERFVKKNGSTIYTFGKWNEATGQYEKIRIEQHNFPPKGKRFIKRCQKECIELEINDVDIVEVETIAENMPNLQNLSFGKNVHKVRREEKNRYKILLENLKNVEFSDDVKVLGDYAFAGCSNLQTINFSEVEMGYDAFSSFKNHEYSAVHIPTKAGILNFIAFDPDVYLEIEGDICKVYRTEGLNSKAITFLEKSSNTTEPHSFMKTRNFEDKEEIDPRVD